MGVQEFAIMLGVFLIIMYAGISYLQSFNVKLEVPSEITKAYNESYQQIQEAKKKVDESVSAMPQAKDAITLFLSAFSAAFGMIQYIAVSLWAIFISMPSAIWGGLNYIANSLGIPVPIVVIINALIGIYITLKLIEFITGRKI